MLQRISLVIALSSLTVQLAIVALAHEEPPKPAPRTPTVAREPVNTPPGAQVPNRKPPEPSPKEKALLKQLRQLESQRDALIKRSVELDRKRLNAQDPAERKRLDEQKLALVRQLDTVERKRIETYRAWQNAAIERWRKENPELAQTPPGAPPGMPPGPSPQVIAKQIQIAEEQLAKLKKEGKPDTDPQVKMYRERIERYRNMLKSTAARPPVPSAPKPAASKK
ncbi:MAG: hypothetical protein NZ520_05400 [bacterium]|nr:hypothetical protein [bacterium]